MQLDLIKIANLLVSSSSDDTSDFVTLHTTDIMQEIDKI